MLGQTDRGRLETQDLILRRMADVIQADPQAAAISLATTSLALLAKVFPAELSAQDQQRVAENMPGATPQRIAQRAMSQEGTRVAVKLGNLLVRAAVDYSPHSCATRHLSQDDAAAPQVRHRAAGAINHGLEAALAEGISPLGAVSMMIRAAVTRAAELDLHPFQVVRPLHEGVERALQRLAPRDWDEREEAGVTALAQQMGISRSRARDHLRQSRSS